MKFSVCSLIIVLLVVHRTVASKGWNAAGYKDGETCSMGWSGYLKRLSIIIFMLSGVVLYYVPESRFYFRRGCHDIIDFVADGLQAGFNTSDTEYVVDDSSIYSEQESEETFGKRSSRRSTDIFEEDHVRTAYITHSGNRIDFNSGSSNESLLNREINLARPVFERNEYPSHVHLRHRECSKPTSEKYPKREGSMALSFDSVKFYPDEIIELEKFSKSRYYCPSERDSDTSGAVSRGLANYRQEESYSRDDEPTVGNDESLYVAEETFTEEKSVIESEPTVYPEDESIYNATTDREDDDDYRRLGEKIETNFDGPTRVDMKLLELDRTLRTVRSTFSRKNSPNILNKEEYAVRIIDAILQTVKRNFEEIYIEKTNEEKIIQVEEGEKNGNQKRKRKSKCTTKISVPQRSKKSTDFKDRKLPVGASGDHLSSSKRKVRTSPKNDTCEESRKRYNTFFLIPGYDMDLPIFTNCVKPMIARIARWFFDGCPSTKCEHLWSVMKKSSRISSTDGTA